VRCIVRLLVLSSVSPGRLFFSLAQRVTLVNLGTTDLSRRNPAAKPRRNYILTLPSASTISFSAILINRSRIVCLLLFLCLSRRHPVSLLLLLMPDLLRSVLPPNLLWCRLLVD